MDEILEILENLPRESGYEVIVWPAQLSCHYSYDNIRQYERERRTPVRKLLKKNAPPKIKFIGRIEDGRNR